MVFLFYFEEQKVGGDAKKSGGRSCSCFCSTFLKKSCFSFKLWKPSFSEPGSSFFFRIDLLSRNPKNNLFRFHFESNYKSVVTLRRFWRSLKSSQEWEKEIHPIFICSCLFLAPAPPRPKLTDVEIKMRWKLENFIKITLAWLLVLVTAIGCGLYQKNTIALIIGLYW